MWLLQYVIGTKDAGQATPITDKLRATLAVGMWGGDLGGGGLRVAAFRHQTCLYGLDKYCSSFTGELKQGSHQRADEATEKCVQF